MDLYILRHGLAEEQAASGGDSQRRLTDAGRRKLRRIARGMKVLGLDFEVILSSPYLRARETAEVVAGVLGIEKRLKLLPALAADGNPKQLIAGLNREHSRRKSILLVGHEPCLSRLISTLISGEPNLPITLKKGGWCKLTTNGLRYGRCAVLEWLLAPAQGKRLQ